MYLFGVTFFLHNGARCCLSLLIFIWLYIVMCLEPYNTPQPQPSLQEKNSFAIDLHVRSLR